LARPGPTSRRPVSPDADRGAVAGPRRCRPWLEPASRDGPAVFPTAFAHGYRRTGPRAAAKAGRRRRRRRGPAPGASFPARPALVLPGTSGWADGVQGPLVPRAFGAPFGAIARGFGRGALSWCRPAVSLGRDRVAGTTARKADRPAHRPADEHHRTRDGRKNAVATTAGAGRRPGAAPARTAGAGDAQAADAASRRAAEAVQPGYRRVTVGADGGAATRQARPALAPPVVLRGTR
jgi:hypothetical protein